MRLENIDAVKGFGIVSFIIWHSYAYYYQYSQASSAVSRSVLFATGLFIGLSGFVFGFHYYSKVQDGYCRRDLFYRIITRSVKLIIYVIAANIFMGILNDEVAEISRVLSNVFSIFYIDRWDISFQVLLVISVGLLLDLFVLFAFIKYRKVFCYLLITFLICYFIVDLIYREHFPYFWRYLPLSVIGTLLGLLYTKSGYYHVGVVIGAVSIVIFVGLCFLASVSKEWYYNLLLETGPYHTLILSGMLGLGFVAQSILCIKNRIVSFISKKIILFGQYSLFAYFAQIILIFISLDFIRKNSLSEDIVIFSIALVVTMFCVILIHLVNWSRRYNVINGLYRLFFE